MDHIPNILIFKLAKHQPVIYFLSKVIFLKRPKSGEKKSCEIAKTNT